MAEFNTLAYSVNRYMLFLEIHIVNVGMNKSNNHQDIGAMSSCMNSMTEAMKGLVQRNSKGATKACFFSTVGFLQRGKLNMGWSLVLTFLV